MVPALIAAGASLLGGFLQGKSTERAARTSANAQLEASRIAAEAAKFRPVGVTTRFGQSNFQTDAQGNLIGAGYTLTPEMQAYQDRLQALAGGGLGQAEMAQQQYAPLQQGATGLFGLGQQYLAQSPQEVAAKYIQQQQDLLAPSRERQMAQLQNQLYQTGRGGLSVGATGARPSGAAGLGATNPELEAYYNALAQQDLQLAAQGQQAGQQQVAFGQNLLSGGAGLLGQYQAGQVGALAPYQAYLSGIQGIEGAGQEALTLGAGLGGQAAAYGAKSGELGLLGSVNAAQAMQKANAYNPFATALTQGAQNPEIKDYLGRIFNSRGPVFTDAYQASIPVNNKSSGYY